MVGIDTNILLYSYDKGSPLYEEAKALIRSMLSEDGIAISDLSLLEFFSVVTDGRKITNPLSAEKALRVIESIWNAEEFCVCGKNAEVMRKAFQCAAELNILRYGINDVYIAMSLSEKGFRKILTRNTRDFKKFDFIEAINPFDQSTPRSLHPASSFIPYGRQSIDEKDVAAVCSVLRSDWLTTGPTVAEFEQAIADYVDAKYAVAVSSGTAALHAAMYAIGIGRGDEVIVPPMTFVATANCVVFQGGIPVFVDVEPDTMLIDPAKVEEKITEKTRAIIGVDYAGQPCDWDRLRDIADRYGLRLVADSCHALGAEYKGRKVGSLADMTVFSFHPVKHITTGEGGMITTDDAELAERMRLFRNHGITRDPKCFSPTPFDLRSPPSDFFWYYEMVDLGYNYRITDIQCALGISQLPKFPDFLKRRREIAAFYHEALINIPGIESLGLRSDVLSAEQYSMCSAPSSMRHVYPVKSDGHSTGASCSTPSKHAYHLYVIKIDTGVLGVDRTNFCEAMRRKGIGLNVHYIPVHLHPFYQKNIGTKEGYCPIAESAYGQILSLPMYPAMSDTDVERVIEAIQDLTGQIKSG